MQSKKRSRFARDINSVAKESEIKNAKTKNVVPEHPFDDYMADELINRLPKDSILASATGCAADVSKKKLKSVSAMMAENLEKGLSTTISESNRGFQLLSKFGYKAGSGLGKNEEGRIEPLNPVKSSIAISTTKETILNDLNARQLAMKAAEMRSGLLASFSSHQSSQYYHGQLKRELFKATKVMYELDLASGGNFTHRLVVAYHEKTTNRLLGVEEEVTIATIDSTKQKELEETLQDLTDILMQLRSTYNYCFYCAARFDDAIDLSMNCPGVTRDCHDEEI